MASSPRNSIGNVRSDMDITYPEHLSRLHRHSILTEYPKSYYNPKKNTRNRRGNRYRTQPITFDEIQEVDEDSMTIDTQNSEEKERQVTTSTADLQLEFYKFSKSLGSKRKKLDPTEVEPPEACSDLDKTQNEVSSEPQSCPQEQLKWTDYTRENSV